jgi:hypothetical protein
MSGLFDRMSEDAVKSAPIEREDKAVVVAFDQDSAAYTLTYRGTDVGPVWSLNAVRYEVGAVVKVVVVGNVVKSVIP